MTEMTTLLAPDIQPEDSLFALVRDNQQFTAQRQVVESLWARYQRYADPGFQQKISRRFHDHFWEMYLACALMDQGYQLAPKYTDKGPDICVLDSGQRVWLEASAPGPGEGADAIPLPQVGPTDYVPEAKVILRLRSALEEKWKKYQAYRANQIVAPADPYVIAVNGGYVPYASAVGFGLPYIFQAVSRLGPKFTTLDRETLEMRDQGYSPLPAVRKVGGAQVPTDIFVDGGYEGISGVLYSGASIWNLPASHGSEFVFIHNVRPANPLHKGWVSGTEFWSESGAWYSRANHRLQRTPVDGHR